MQTPGTSEDRLRKLALVACMFQTLAMSTIPAVVYCYVYRLDALGLGPQAWVIWAVALFTGLLGVLAHGTASVPLTVGHLLANALLGAALGAYTTAWWFVLQLQCGLAQGAFGGCAGCTCAQASTCTADELAAPGCAGCEAPRADVCAAVHQTYNMYLLAFTGLAALASALPSLALDVHVLLEGGASRAAHSGRRQAMRVAVDQQTRLVVAGDKPTVTPGTLADWVSSLTASADAVLVASADRCCAALRARGYELAVRGRTKLAVGPAQGALFRTATDRDAAREATRRNGGGGRGDGGDPGSGDLLDDAERGEPRAPKLRKVKPQQVTPEQTPVAESPVGVAQAS